jgi:hypothetical protein
MVSVERFRPRAGLLGIDQRPNLGRESDIET